MSRRTAYSPLRHFFLAVWLNYDPEKTYVMMAKCYTIYGDASGQSNSGDILCVTGLGSTASRWSKFEPRWEKLLTRYGITPPFHMTDFATGGGEYREWRKSHTKKEEEDFFAEVIKILKLSINKGFAISVAVDDLRYIQRTYRLADDMGNDNPYTWCTLLLYHSIKKWLEQHSGPTDSIKVVFESGDIGYRAFPNRLRELYPTIDPPGFSGKLLAPLQAVDFLAYEFRNGVIRQSKGCSVRKSLSEILRRLPIDLRHYSRTILLRITERGAFPKRSENEIRSLNSGDTRLFP